MKKLFKNKYRIPSARLPGWDYTNSSLYFLTICTQYHFNCFGKIVSAKMVLSDVGAIAEKYWTEIPYHFKHVQLGPFVVMPDHMHGVLILNGEKNDKKHGNVRSVVRGSRDAACNDSINMHMSEKSPKPGSVSTIIRSYKSPIQNTH